MFKSTNSGIIIFNFSFTYFTKTNQMKTIQIILLILIIIGLGLIFTQKYWVNPLVNFILRQTEEKVIKNDPLNISFTIDGQIYTFKNGEVQKPGAPGSVSKEVVRVFGEPVYGDLTGDKLEDAVMFITRQTGGSGTFFYVVEAINYNGIYKGTSALFLGDRIAPQNINIIDGQAVANFAERGVSEPMTVSPSVGKSVWIQFNPITGELSENKSKK
ncbi:MAG: hypothetical protein WC657_01425 [Candidatus Paceibacterota bacterium]|jgi:hypothetical protein